jgi:lysophospholipid acyltransferase (LPLAT)-like uncharacterized protein
VALGRLKLALARPGWRLLSVAWSCNEAPPPDGRARIYACLHRDIMPAIRYCRSARPTLLVSKSPDGQILARALADDGFGFVRGSTGHDGHEGFVGLLRVLRAGGVVGVAVDGPRGPFGHVHPGALQLARRSGAPIIALTVRCRGCVQLRTWDRTVVPLPGARLQVAPADPLIVAADAGPEQLARAARDLGARLGLAAEDTDGRP